MGKLCNEVKLWLLSAVTGVRCGKVGHVYVKFLEIKITISTYNWCQGLFGMIMLAYFALINTKPYLLFARDVIMNEISFYKSINKMTNDRMLNTSDELKQDRYLYQTCWKRNPQEWTWVWLCNKGFMHMNIIVNRSFISCPCPTSQM